MRAELREHQERLRQLHARHKTGKRCGRCRGWLSFEAFRPDSRSANGWSSYCNDCAAAANREWREVIPATSTPTTNAGGSSTPSSSARRGSERVRSAARGSREGRTGARARPSAAGGGRRARTRAGRRRHRNSPPPPATLRFRGHDERVPIEPRGHAPIGDFLGLLGRDVDGADGAAVRVRDLASDLATSWECRSRCSLSRSPETVRRRDHEAGAREGVDIRPDERVDGPIAPPITQLSQPPRMQRLTILLCGASATPPGFAAIEGARAAERRRLAPASAVARDGQDSGVPSRPSYS